MRSWLPSLLLASLVIASIIFVLASFGTAHAHEDRLLTLGSDGSIAGLPQEYLPAELLLDRDQKGKVLRASLALSSGRYTFPECMLRLFDQNPRAKIVLTASWYHEETLLPYYISMTFQNENKGRRSEKSHILFNLRTAELLDVTKIISERTEYGTHESSEPYFERVCLGRKMTDGWKRTPARSGEPP